MSLRLKGRKVSFNRNSRMGESLRLLAGKYQPNLSGWKLFQKMEK